MAFTQDFRTQRRNYNDGETRVGEKDRLWYDSNTNSIRISDGVTPGGVVVGGSGGGGNYVLPTASVSVKGGVKIDGTSITISEGVISANLSSYATQTFVTTRGYLTSYTETDPVFLAHAANNVTNAKITNWDTAYGWGNHASAGYLTSVGTISYNDLSNKPTLFSGSYTDLTNKPTLFDGAYASLTGKPTLFSGSYADLTNKPTIPTTVTVNGTAITLGSSGSLNSLINGSDTLSLNGANKVDLPGGTSYIFSAANNISLFSDTSGSNYLEIINNVGATLSTDRGFEIRTNVDGTDRVWSFTQGGSFFFPDSTYQTTAYTTNAARALFSAANASASGSGGSLAYSSGVFTFTPALNITGNAETVTNGVYTTGSYADPSWITSLSYSKLTGVPASAQQFTFNVAADDSTLRTISSEETVKFIGAGGITTASDAEGAITITQGAAAAGTLTGTTLNSTVVTSSLTSVGTLTNLTVSGSATVASNTATDKYINVGTHGQLFDDGNLHIHTSSGTLWINSLDSSNIKLGTQYNSGSGSDVDIGKNLIANNGSVTANATTAFIAGSNAVSNVSLQMPSESALRNLTNGATNMYFDVSIGGSTHGQFQFRSSSSYTNVLTMSTTAVSFNTGATVTARTPALARTSFNAAIDTEITVDSMRFRISNQGGIFPQVIGNGSSRNLAWTAVGAISGTAINQVGSTGTIVASNAWTTLYNSHGMDSAGDTVTVTLQDKAGSAIYRITFMRSDNGSTTGYNIIGERIL